VTYKGEPLAGGSVLIVDPAGGFHQAIIEDDGSYSIPQVPVGDAKVAVTYTDPQVGDYIREKVGGGAVGSKSARAVRKEVPRKLDESKLKKIPEHYSDADKSGLKTAIQAGQNTYDIPLK
jgi:hypothetical protein